MKVPWEHSSILYARYKNLKTKQILTRYSFNSTRGSQLPTYHTASLSVSFEDTPVCDTSVVTLRIDTPWAERHMQLLRIRLLSRVGGATTAPPQCHSSGTAVPQQCRSCATVSSRCDFVLLLLCFQCCVRCSSLSHILSLCSHTVRTTSGGHS